MNVGCISGSDMRFYWRTSRCSRCGRTYRVFLSQDGVDLQRCPFCIRPDSGNFCKKLRDIIDK